MASILFSFRQIAFLLGSLAFLFLSSCTPPIYQNTTYGLDEFMADSQQISGGKYAILALEEHEEICNPVDPSDHDDVIHEGDELKVMLYCPRRLEYMQALDMIQGRTGSRVCDGKISLPHLSPLEVAGLTLRECREIIQNAYSEEISEAQVFIEFKKKCERNVQIIGARKSMIAVDGKMRLSEVLAQAKLPPHANLFKSYVMRNGQKLPIDLYPLIHEGSEYQNIVMKGGDQIFIAHATDAPIMLTGELHYSMAIPAPYGRLSLREALAAAGGIAFTGNKNCILIIRGDLVRPKIYSLAWKDIIHCTNQSLLLIPGDVVVLSEKPVTQWNRFVNQLQPSTDCMQTTLNLYESF